MKKRFDEHSKSDKESALLEHLKKSGHSISFDDVSILSSEPRYNARKIKEALEIYKHKPTLNRDQGYEIKPVLLQLLTPPNHPHTPPGSKGPRLQVGMRNRANSM